MNINEILLRFFTGKASKEELSQLDQWKKETEANLAHLEEMKSIWSASNDMKDWGEFDQKSAWESVSDKIVEVEPSIIKTPSSARVLSISRLWKVAAIGLLLVMATITYSFINSEKNIEEAFVGHYESKGSAKDVILPDGSVVTLSPFSSFDILPSFTTKRNVKLNGNAFFKVSRDENSPFTVYTNKGEIKVLGTSFNIINHQEKFELFVEEGKVAYTHNDRTVTLSRNDKAVLLNDNIVKSKEYNQNYLSWKRKKLIFKDAQWIDVFKDISRHYDIKIDFNAISQSDCKLNTTINSETVEEVLEELKILWNLEYQKVDNSIKVSGLKC